MDSVSPRRGDREAEPSGVETQRLVRVAYEHRNVVEAPEQRHSLSFPPRLGPWGCSRQNERRRPDGPASRSAQPRGRARRSARGSFRAGAGSSGRAGARFSRRMSISELPIESIKRRRLVVGGARDCAVELQIVARGSFDIGGLPLHALVDLAQLGDVFVGRALGGGRRGEPRGRCAGTFSKSSVPRRNRLIDSLTAFASTAATRNPLPERTSITPFVTRARIASRTTVRDAKLALRAHARTGAGRRR